MSISTLLYLLYWKSLWGALLFFSSFLYNPESSLSAGKESLSYCNSKVLRLPQAYGVYKQGLEPFLFFSVPVLLDSLGLFLFPSYDPKGWDFNSIQSTTYPRLSNRGFHRGKHMIFASSFRSVASPNVNKDSLPQF